jgi:hypothetical protein
LRFEPWRARWGWMSPRGGVDVVDAEPPLTAFAHSLNRQLSAVAPAPNRSLADPKPLGHLTSAQHLCNLSLRQIILRDRSPYSGKKKSKDGSKEHVEPPRG